MQLNHKIAFFMQKCVLVCSCVTFRIPFHCRIYGSIDLCAVEKWRSGYWYKLLQCREWSTRENSHSGLTYQSVFKFWSWPGKVILSHAYQHQPPYLHNKGTWSRCWLQTMVTVLQSWKAPDAAAQGKWRTRVQVVTMHVMVAPKWLQYEHRRLEASRTAGPTFSMTKSSVLVTPDDQRAHDWCT